MGGTDKGVFGIIPECSEWVFTKPIFVCHEIYLFIFFVKISKNEYIYSSDYIHFGFVGNVICKISPAHYARINVRLYTCHTMLSNMMQKEWA